MKVHTKHMADDTDGLRHSRFQELDTRGHRPDYKSHRVVPSSDGEKCYLVSKVGCLDVAFSPDVDIADAQVDVFLCGCDHFNYRLAKDVAAGEAPPSSLQKCKHVIAGYRAEKAANDDSQVTL